MQFTIEHPNGTTTTESRDVSYYDGDEGTVYSIKRKRELTRIAERLVPDDWMTYNVSVAGDIQREGDMPYGVEAEPFIIRDEVGRGNAKVYAAPMRKDELARAARFRTAFTDEYNQLCEWYRDRLEESAAAWGGVEELEGVSFEEYFGPCLSAGFLFNSVESHEVHGGEGPSNVIVRANEKARGAFRHERDALLFEKWAEEGELGSISPYPEQTKMRGPNGNVESVEIQETEHGHRCIQWQGEWLYYDPSALADEVRWKPYHQIDAAELSFSRHEDDPHS